MITTNKKLIVIGLAAAMGIATFIPVASAESVRPTRAEAAVLKVREVYKKKFDKTRIQDARKQFDGAKERLLIARDDLTNQKQFLTRVIDSLIKHAELLKTRVENLPVIDDELEARIITEINSDISKLEDLREEVEGSTTSEELKRIREELSSHQKETYNNKVRGLVLLAHLGVYEHKIVATMEMRLDRIQTYLNDLESEGKDIQVVQGLLNRAKTKIDEVKNKIDVMEESIQQNETDLNFLKRIQNELGEVKSLIKEVYQIFREVVTKAKELR